MAYYEALERARPYLQQRHLLRPSEMPKIPPRPQPLEMLEKVDKWGFPNPGTWMDQPKDFMADIEAARDARDEYKARPREPTVQASFADAPPFGTITAR